MLKEEGEGIGDEELNQYLQLLVGEDVDRALEQQISADGFAENILGFEEVEEDDEEDFEDQPGQEEEQSQI